MHHFFRRLIALCVALMGLAPAAAEPLPSLILVQNSGWMEPFFTDPRSDFRARLKALGAVAAEAGGEVMLATFNQNGQVPGRASPEVRYRGEFEAQAIDKAIESIDLPRKPNGAFADSDFAEALRLGISDLLQGRPGIIWLVTNNQNAPGNTPDWEARTRDFFRLLKTSEGITRVYAHPIRGPASGSVFGRREGYIIYALAYGDSAAEPLDALIASDAANRTFGAPAVRLKPLDRETIRFEVTESSCKLFRARQSDWVQVRVDGGEASDCVLDGRLRNRLYPQTIEEARVRVTLTPRESQPGLERARILIDPGAITGVPAGGLSGPVRIRLQLPPLRRDGLFDRETRAAGVLRIALEDIRYGWDQEFLERLSAVPLGSEIGAEAAGALVDRQLPEIFVEATRLTTSQSDIPLQVIATHSRWPLYLLLALLLVAIVALVWWSQSRSARKSYEFTVDLGGELHKVTLRQGDRLIVRNSRNSRFEVLGQGKKPPIVRPMGDLDRENK